MTISDIELRLIARADPHVLIRMLRSDANAGDLARFASAAKSSDLDAVRPVLIGLARTHASPLVREAALDGLEGDVDESTGKIVRFLAEHDTNDAVRALALDMLEDFDDG